MRKVKFKQYIKDEYEEVIDGNGAKKKVRKEGTGCVSDFIYEGVFHQWGHEVEEAEESVAHNTLAIIELPNGEIKMVWPNWVKFI